MKEFLYAAGYYPLVHSKEDWMKDLDTMEKCGIRVIRTAEIFNGWDQIEPEKGRFIFDTLDEFFDECAKRGIGILLGTGTASPPYWLHQSDPEVNILSASGKRFPNNVVYSWACFHNPTYLAESKRYISTLVNRYKNHPALFAYQIHNEIGLPFMSPTGEGVEMYCYCHHSKDEFRKWVKEKYKTLENLNKAWFWSASSTHHTHWDMVEPPYAKPTSWSSVTRYLDFRLFMMDTITDFVGWQHELIRSLDITHPTSTNIFYMKGEDKLSVLTGIDQFELAKKVDVIGYDLYPGSGDKHESRPEFSSMFLDHGRSVAQFAHKPFWLMEVESGPINGWAMGPNRTTNADDIRRYITEAVGHNAKMTLYQGFRQWDFQPLNWGGLVDLDGNPTQRTEMAAVMGGFVKEHSEFLMEAQPYKSEVAILTSKQSNIIAHGMGHEDMMVKALRSYYRIFWEMGYQIDFITPELLREHGNEYKVICAPFMLSLSQEESSDIGDYIKNGGIFIAEPRLGYVNEQGWYNHQQPPFNLQKALGVNQQEIHANVNSKITYKGKNYSGYWHKEKLEVCGEKAKVLASFFDDTPGVVLQPFGKGLGVYFATYAAEAYLEKDSLLFWDVMVDILKEEGIKPRLLIEYSNKLDREIDGHLLSHKGKDMLFITVYNKKNREDFFVGNKKQLKITIEGSYKKITDAYSKKEIPFSSADNRTVINAELEKHTDPIWILEKE